MTAKQRAAEYNILIGEYRSANKLCTKILGENPDHTEAKIIQFNVECLIAEEKNKEREKTGKERRAKDEDGEGKEEKGKDKKLVGILQEMQSLMSRNSASRVLIDGNMAISRYYLSKKKFNESLEALNKILVACPWYFPASLEKVRVFSTQTKWDQCEEILNTILANDSNQIEAVMYKLFVDSIIDSNIDLVNGLKDLLMLYNKLEPKNAELYYKVYIYIQFYNFDFFISIYLMLFLYLFLLLLLSYLYFSPFFFFFLFSLYYSYYSYIYLLFL